MFLNKTRNITTLFQPRNNSAKKVQACILDWSGTTADAFAIAPAKAFCDTFKAFKVPITMDEARKKSN